MAIDDAAGRKSVRQRRTAPVQGDSVFVTKPRHSYRPTSPSVTVLRDDVHARALEAAKKVLRSRSSGNTGAMP